MNIVVFDECELGPSGALSFTGRRAQHLRKVLGVKPGSLVRVGQLGSSRGQAIVEKVDKLSVDLTVQHLLPTEEHSYVDLIVAMPRPQTVKKILELAAATSIGQVTFIDSRKVEKSYFQSSVLEPENISKHICLGLEQGQKVMVPGVSVERSFLKSLNVASRVFTEASLGLLFDSEAPRHLSDDILIDSIKSSKKITIAIGPEGGWQEHELDYFANLGFHSCRLLDSTLRVEYALCAAIAQIEQLRRFKK